jgi:alkanesulfonate monooxygenase SsuD/methylene tetrahydromethanopterin reductase-like flavin-dependent oxidoreductase (luciferase family)
MRIGLSGQLHQDPGTAGPPPWALIREVARRADAAGLDSYWVYDHLLFRDGGSTIGIHEAWTMLSAIAASTERIAIGTLVLCTAFRNPALLAKMAVTLDEISGGRLVLGLGAGWNEPEFEAFGYPFEGRVWRFADQVAIIHGLLGGRRVSHDSEIGRFIDAELAPPPTRHVPILIASKRPRMHDLTARYADRWNAAWYGLPDDDLRTKIAAVLAACERAGRDPATLEITVGVSVRFPDLLGETALDTGKGSGAALVGSAGDIAAGLAAHADLGVDEAIVSLEPFTTGSVGRFLEAAAIYRA